MDAEEIKAIKTEMIQRNLDFETILGRSFAPEFISILADNAENTLREWMKKNGCPEQAVYLLEEVIMLERYNILLENHHTLSDWDARGLIEEIGNITESIAQLGGTFTDGYLSTNPRENVITWQPGEVVETQKDNIDLDVGGG